MTTTSQLVMVYHENGGNESFIVGGRKSQGGFMSTLKAGSDPNMVHNILVIRHLDESSAQAATLASVP